MQLRTRARISAHVIWDHFVDPTALVQGDVPWRAEAASPEWLTAVLCGQHPDARVIAAEVSGGGDGSSIRRRITVSYNTDGKLANLPEHLFVKVTPSLLTRLTAGLIAAGEGAFYRQIKPALPIETPPLYYSGSDLASGRSLHLFEDIVLSKGAQFCHLGTEITQRHAEDMVDLLAVVHGTFYNSPRFATDLAWLGRHVDYVENSARNGSREYHERAMTLARHVIPADVMTRRDEIWAMLLAGLRVHDEEPVTLLHSDVHFGNWYRTGEGRMGLCDWAIACKGNWARDFAYAISTSLAIPDRRAWERDLLRRYLDGLHASGGPVVAFDDAWSRYNQQTFAALIMWTPTLCPVPTRPQMQTEAMSLEMIHRITTAISDLNALDSQG